MTPDTSSHSGTRIVGATALALGVAVVVLLTTVLPAEYNLDPTGVGRWLGLTDLATAGQDEESGPTTGGSLEAVRAGAHTPQAGTLTEDTYTVELRPFEGVEYKYRLERGQGLLYSWTATGAVDYDLHGEPDGAPARYSESYDKGESASASGLLIAPTPGVHGWFWENTGSGRITVTLHTSGFLTSATEYRDGDRVERRVPAIR